MIEGTVNAKLVVDLGNSETRVTVLFGSDGHGKMNRKTSVISNRYALLNPDVVIGDAIDESNSYIFKAHGSFKDEVVTGQYVGGLIVSREYHSVMIRPTNLNKKYESLPAVLALNVAFAEGYNMLSILTGQVIEDLDVVWSVSVLLPPADVGNPANPNSGGIKMAKVVRSIDQIEFSMPNITKRIVIADGGVKVLPEGFCAFIACVFKPGREVRSGFEQYIKDSVLIIDEGAGTTDFMVIDSAKPIESTKHTIEIGGNTTERSLSRLAREQGIRIDSVSAKRAMLTGTVKDGASEISVVDLISKAKQETANQLLNGLMEFFETTQYDPRNVGQLLVVGGGASHSDLEGIVPIADFLVEGMRAYSPNVGLMPLPMKTVTRNGERVSISEDPRVLNIKGAAILSE